MGGKPRPEMRKVEVMTRSLELMAALFFGGLWLGLMIARVIEKWDKS